MTSFFAGPGVCHLCPLSPAPYPLRDLQELDESHLRVLREERPVRATHVSSSAFQPSSSCYLHSCRIKCKIFKTKEDITIKISDQVGQDKLKVTMTQLTWQGGGISRNDKRKVFNYMYSTAPQVSSLRSGSVLFIFPASGH